MLLLFRYAEGKEATVVISAMLPSSYSRNVDFYLNVNIPGFNSCTARFQAIERTKRLQYDVSGIDIEIENDNENKIENEIENENDNEKEIENFSLCSVLHINIKFTPN